MAIALPFPEENLLALPAEAVRRVMIYSCALILMCAGLVAAPQASANALCLASTAFAQTV